MIHIYTLTSPANIGNATPAITNLPTDVRSMFWIKSVNGIYECIYLFIYLFIDDTQKANEILWHVNFIEYLK